MRLLGILFVSLFISGLATSAPASIPATKSKSILSPGFALPVEVNSGETGAGVSFGWLSQTEFSPKLFWGGDFGLHFLGKANSPTQSTTAFQFLPTLVYIGGATGKLSPTMGISAGPYWYVAQANGAKGIDFMLLFRPGLQLNVGQATQLWLEGKFGSLAGELIVLPTLSLNFAL